MKTSTLAICLFSAVLLSAAVNADELTQVIQKDLTALGYDPGNTKGEATTETIVAISQFQAENGLEVTGEASPQLAGVIKARLEAKNNPGSTSVPATATAPANDPAALQAAQQACIQEKMAEAREAQKKKRGFGRLMRAVTRTASRLGGDTARDISQTTRDIYDVDATAADLSQAAKDLGLTESDLEECRNPPVKEAHKAGSDPGGGTTSSAGTDGGATPSGSPGAMASVDEALQQLTPEQRQELQRSGMGDMIGEMMGGANAGGDPFASQPENNIVLPESYSFSYRVTMRITNSQGTVEPVFYVQPDAPYYARKQSKNGLIEFLVYDNQSNLAVLFAEKDGEKRRIHNRMNMEARATLLGAYRDAPQKEPVKSIGSKTILGYSSQGYEISTLGGTTQLWVTDGTPASLFSTMFEHRADATRDSPLSKSTMIMEVTFTSAHAPEENYHMECTELQPDTLILSKSDYQT